MESLESSLLSLACARLERSYREVYERSMRTLPIVQPELQVEAVGFMSWGEGWLGALVTPWFLNLIYLVPVVTAPAVITLRFEDLELSFESIALPGLDAFRTLALISPMGEIPTQAYAREVAQGILLRLTTPLPAPYSEPVHLLPAGGLMERPMSRRGFFSQLIPSISGTESSALART